MNSYGRTSKHRGVYNWSEPGLLFRNIVIVIPVFSSGWNITGNLIHTASFKDEGMKPLGIWWIARGLTTEMWARTLHQTYLQKVCISQFTALAALWFHLDYRTRNCSVANQHAHDRNWKGMVLFYCLIEHWGKNYD